MNLQIIKSMKGQAEYVLLPFAVYNTLREEIHDRLHEAFDGNEYVSFEPEDYIDNPVALARIKAKLSQKQLAKRMKVTQAYISKLERQDKVSVKTLQKMRKALS